MRKFLIPLLMAGVVMPAAAYARPDNDESRHERSADHRGDRSSKDSRQRAERVQRADRPAQSELSHRAVRVERTGRKDGALTIEQRQVRQVEPREEVRQVHRSDRNMNDGIRVVTRDRQEGAQVRRRTDGAFTGIPHRTTERQVRTSDHRRWSNDWRRDHRYDWRNYRNSHRSLFRLSRYFDPYGYNYRRFSIGFNLGSSYYGSNYWLDDPWMYRLPPAYGPYRWVRYYDDALLVNIYTGQVVDVLYSFFW